MIYPRMLLPLSPVSVRPFQIGDFLGLNTTERAQMLSEAEVGFTLYRFVRATHIYTVPYVCSLVLRRT